MSVKNRVKDIDRGYEEFKDQLDEMGDSTVTVGFHADEVDSEQILVASVHEFGAPKAGIPERSFLRSAVRENKGKYGTTWPSLLKNVLANNLTLKQALSLMGEQARADIQQKIVDLQRPPLAPETIEQKKEKSGKSAIKMVDGVETGNPLIDTGNMRQSVNYQVHID